MPRRYVLLGAAVGVAAAAVILATLPSARPPAIAPTGPVLSDCDGQIRELVIQYVSEAAEIVAPVYREFLAHLPADVTVHVVCPDGAAYDDFRRRVGAVACKLSAVPTGHAMTSWSRDRWVALSPAEAGAPVTLLRPRGEDAAAGWPARAGDQRVADDLAAALRPAVASRRSELYFDGGDFAADSSAVFVTPDVAMRNVQHTVKGRPELLEALGRALKRRVILLDQAPPHHAGMFMMPAGGGVVLVGDPAAARGILAGHPLPADTPPGGADFTPGTQALFDAVAARCAAEGYKVVRIPLVPGSDGRTYLTYVNVILDPRDGRPFDSAQGAGRIVYMPTYRGADALNEAAAGVWRGCGYEVRPVDCTSAYGHFGALHCLVNVLRR